MGKITKYSVSLTTSSLLLKGLADSFHTGHLQKPKLSNFHIIQTPRLMEQIMTNKKYKPGEKVPRSGQYKNTRTKREITAVKGEPFPPTPGAGQKYVLVDKTKHKNQ